MSLAASDSVSKVPSAPDPPKHVEAARRDLEGHRPPALVIIMGVSGCGKSTIGQGLADRLGCQFKDGDELHLESSVEKMSRGEPLTDEDRWPWLHKIRQAANEMTAHPNDHRAARPTNRPTIVIACSALKRKYRDLLRGFVDEHGQHLHEKGVQTFFLYLKGSEELLMDRMKSRKGHFMKADMLRSQLETLEEPTPDEDDYHGVIVVELTNEVDDVLNRAEAGVREALGVGGPRNATSSA